MMKGLIAVFLIGAALGVTLADESKLAEMMKFVEKHANARCKDSSKAAALECEKILDPEITCKCVKMFKGVLNMDADKPTIDDCFVEYCKSPTDNLAKIDAAVKQFSKMMNKNATAKAEMDTFMTKHQSCVDKMKDCIGKLPEA